MYRGDPQGAAEAAFCSRCGGGLYEWDPAWALEGSLICWDCMGCFGRDWFAWARIRVGDREGAWP